MEEKKRETRKRPRAGASAELDLLECSQVEMSPWEAIAHRTWPGETAEEQAANAKRAVRWFIADGIFDLWLAEDEEEHPVPAAQALRLLEADDAWAKDGPYLMAMSEKGSKVWHEGAGWSWWRDATGEED
jgi:hypothetical protein